MKKLFLLLLLLTACNSEKALEPAEIQTSVIEIPEPTPESVTRARNGNLWALEFDKLPFGFSIPRDWEIFEDSSSYKITFGTSERFGFMTLYKEPEQDSFQDIVTQATEVFYNDGKGVNVYCDGLDGYLGKCVVRGDEFDGFYVIEIRQSGVDVRNVISSVRAD